MFFHAPSFSDLGILILDNIYNTNKYLFFKSFQNYQKTAQLSMKNLLNKRNTALYLIKEFLEALLWGSKIIPSPRGRGDIR